MTREHEAPLGAEGPSLLALKDGEIHTVDDAIFGHADGTAIPVEYTSTPFLENGAPSGAVVIFRDVSRLRLELALPDATMAPPAPATAERTDPGDSEGDHQTESELRALERANLIAVLRHANGRIWGPHGAAALLGIEPSTLSYRMRGFGIKKPNSTP